MAAQASLMFFATRYWISVMPQRPPLNCFVERDASWADQTAKSKSPVLPSGNREGSSHAKYRGARRETGLRGAGPERSLGRDLARRPPRARLRPPVGGADRRG